MEYNRVQLKRVRFPCVKFRDTTMQFLLNCIIARGVVVVCKGWYAANKRREAFNIKFRENFLFWPHTHKHTHTL